VTAHRLQIPRLFPFQAEASDDPSWRKQLNWGRRSGKTRGMLTISVLGHGPLDEEGNRLHRGLVQGGSVLWVSLDYKQLKSLWREDIKPRWKAAGLYTNDQDWEATLGKGRLLMRSAENPGNIRGAGKGIVGVILDESAHWDVEGVLDDIIRPILLDEDAWLIMASTPNAGSDTHLDEVGQRVTPSFFNRTALKNLEMAKKGTPTEWFYSHADARLNPKISKVAWDRLISEYPEGSLKLLQEVFAQLLSGGTGFGFPELSAHIHQRVLRMPPKAELVAGIDWGYAKPGWLGVFVRHTRGMHLLWEFPFNGPFHQLPNRLTPVALVRAVAPVWREMVRSKRWPSLPLNLYTDSAMGARPDAGKSVNDQLFEGFDEYLGQQSPLIVPVPKGPGSRHARKLLFHGAFDYRMEDSDHGRTMLEPPRFTVDPSCLYWWNTVSGLTVDPKDAEDVDTTGEDHAYDGSGYAMMAEFPELASRRVVSVPDAVDVDRLSQKANREFDREVQQELARIKQRRSGAGRSYG